MVLSKEALIESVKAKIDVNNPSEEDIKLVEDVTDTLNEYESRSQTDWKQKYEENDRMWRTRYLERFKGKNEETEEIEEIEEEKEEKTDICALLKLTIFIILYVYSKN